MIASNVKAKASHISNVAIKIEQSQFHKIQTSWNAEPIGRENLTQSF